MKIFVITFVLISIIYGSVGHCIRGPSGDCPQRVFPPPPPRDIEYIYQGEACNCHKYHDLNVEVPRPPCPHKIRLESFGYNVDVPEVKQESDYKRYLFDVRIDKPVEKIPQKLSSFGFQVQVPEVKREQQVHYIFDTKVQTPVKKCEEKPYLGLVSQVDKVLMPSQDCYNPQHTPDTCDCASNDYKLPIQYNSRYESVLKNNPQYSIDPVNHAMSTIKRKREVTDDKPIKSKLRTKIAKKLKAQKVRSAKRKLLTKDLPAPSLLKSSTFLKPKSKRNPKSKNLKSSSLQLSDPNFTPSQFSQYSSRPKRGPSNSSPCGYTYESCDVAKHNKEGCPLCYKCKCEPVQEHDPKLRFQPNDIKIPYKVVTARDNTPAEAVHFQEFDHEAKSYTGLKKPDQYNDYIQHVLTKYPEHLARNMPDMKGQQADLMKFIDELAKNKAKPGVRSNEEEDKYKFIDNAMDFYKFYQNSLAKSPLSMPGNQFDPKTFQKRGTLLEVIDLNPDNFESYEGDTRDDSHYTYN